MSHSFCSRISRIPCLQKIVPRTNLSQQLKSPFSQRFSYSTDAKTKSPRRRIPPVDQDPWYKKNRDMLKFSCTECGACCTGEPGVVYLSVRDIMKMSRRIKMPVEKFCQQYIRVVVTESNTMHYALKEIERNGEYDCVFLEDGKCQVYLDRPMQCRTYPFWSHIVESEEAWKEEMKDCEGIGRGDKTIDPEELERLVAMDEKGKQDSEYIPVSEYDISEEELEAALKQEEEEAEGQSSSTSQ